MSGSQGWNVGAVALLLVGLFLAENVHAENVIRPLRIAGVVTLYRPNSHADVILTRLLETETLDGQGNRPQLELVSVYADQLEKNDLSQPYSQQYGFRHSPTVADALTLGTGKLAVDGVIMIAEHGQYPESETGQTVYPKRRLFGEIAAVFEASQRTVPVFSDKHLADNTEDGLWFYETARRLQIPLMAGSSITTTWRKPALDTDRHQPLQEILVVSYGPLDAYGFHAIELLQSLAERRAGGESGVASVRCLTGDEVWNAEPRESYDRQLLTAAMDRLTLRPGKPGLTLQQKVKQPVAFVIDYRDGLRGTVVTLNGAAAQWSAAWKSTADSQPQSLLVDLQDERPFMHFGHLLRGIDRFMHTRQPTWPVERTLFSTLILDAALTSRLQEGRAIPTPALDRRYQSTWNWSQPTETGRSLATK